MNELVSRQVAIEYLIANMKWFNEDGYESDDDYKRECITDLINGVPSAQTGWIPITERLPDVRQWVLCQCRAGIMDVLRLTASGSWNKNYPCTEYMSGFVIAWMPLPEPYKGVQDE